MQKSTSFEVPYGIHVPKGSSITIYSETGDGTGGHLEVGQPLDSIESRDAAIGGNSQKSTDSHRAAHASTDGEMTFTCKVCGATKIEPIPSTSQKGVNAAPVKMKTSGKKALVIAWSKVSGAEGYDVFFGKAGKSCKKIKTIKGNKTYKLKAKVVKTVKAKKLMPKKYAKKLRYFSTNKKVATVTSAGKIKAKAAGTCTVYVYAHNGACRKVKVTVK